MCLPYLPSLLLMQFSASLSSSKAKVGMCKLRHMGDMISCLGVTTSIGDRALDCIQICPIIQFSALPTKLHYSWHYKCNLFSPLQILHQSLEIHQCACPVKCTFHRMRCCTQSRYLWLAHCCSWETFSAPHEPLVALPKWNRDCSMNNSKIRLL